MRHVRALWRSLRLIGHAASGLWTIRTRFAGWSQDQREQAVQAWAARLLALTGIRLQVSGEPMAAGPVLLVANHISWLDIVVMHAAGYCRFVSKADVAHWPLVGRLATGAGTLYIERASRRDAMRVVHHMRDRLAAGDVVAIFPEGTTGDGRALLPFHANLVQAAISASGCTGTSALIAACTRLAWKGSSTRPSPVVPSGKIATTSPAASRSRMWCTTRMASRREARSI